MTSVITTKNLSVKDTSKLKTGNMKRKYSTSKRKKEEEKKWLKRKK